MLVVLAGDHQQLGLAIRAEVRAQRPDQAVRRELGAAIIRAVIGMALGFLYFVADNFALAMGNLGAYPPWLAAGGPFLLFLAIGEAVLIRTEE